MEILNQISTKYYTDKGNRYHNYLEIYEKYFTPIRFSAKTILEIGIDHGGSLEIWQEYFTNALIYGLDILPKEIPGERIKTIVGNQQITDDLIQASNVINHKIDVIIDDGGHRMKEQQISLAVLFPVLTAGGIYIIEDLETSGYHEYIESDDITTLEMLRHYETEKMIISNCMTTKQKTYLEQNIKSLVIEKGAHSEIVFITKK